MITNKHISTFDLDAFEDRFSLYPNFLHNIKDDKTPLINLPKFNLPQPQSQQGPINITDIASAVQSCPLFIREIVSKFTTEEEQLMALYSTIVFTGSLMPYIKINYDNKINFPALMLLVVFPPASGKGGLSLVRTLGNKINNELLTEYQKALTQFKADERAYQKAIKSGLQHPPPIEPNQVLFLAPGDATTARLVKQLADNGPGQFLTMFETELDVVTDSSSNSQYGKGFSTIIRKSFHFEDISQMRKTAGELLIANQPKLCMVLSGTPSQVIKMFKNNEDGMYSRFSVVLGNAPIRWKNVKPDPTKQPLDDFFADKAQYFYEMWQYYKGRHVEVTFTDDQWKAINSFGEHHLAVTHNFIDELSGSIAKRHANMLTRFAAILTMIRYFDDGAITSGIVCNDIDFGIARWMTEKSLAWSIELYKTLPLRPKTIAPGFKEQLLRNLPDQFLLSQAKIQFPHIKERSLKRYLRELVDSKVLVQPRHGEYQKTPLALLALAQLDANQSARED